MRAVFGWPLLALGLFFLSTLIGSTIPANNDWQQPEHGIVIFVENNGIHVSLVLPMAAAGEDLSNLIRPDQLSNPVLYGTHAMIGWGHGRVYRNAEKWSDVESGDFTSAVFGSGFTTLHVYHLVNPEPAPHRKAFRVTPAQYRSIIKQVRATFRLDKDHNSIAHPGYAADNVFYDSYGYYSAVNTCNTWTGSILRNAGVQVGIWTPLPGGIMRWF